MSKKQQNKLIPYHVAVVPDGNRRWAKRGGLTPWQGHEEGARRIEDISREALKIGIKCLTFWGSSIDNLTKRPLKEKQALLKIYEKYFRKLIEDDEVYRNETRIRILGRWEEQFPTKLKNLLRTCINKTKQHRGNFLNFLLAYSGEDDILEAIKKIIHQFWEKEKRGHVTRQSIQRNLITAALPEVDLIIRTGVENDPHNSAGFLMWQTMNSQYYFSDKYFPDFSAKEFRRAIENFTQRERRLGK
jgi:undecaprenyl diphosphate synthase